MKNKKILVSISVLVAVIAFAVSVPAFAEDGQNGRGMMGRPEKMPVRQVMEGIRPVAVGKVSSVNGNTITITSKGFEHKSATTTYTIDGSNAVVVKGNATSTVAGISVGDEVIVQGTLTGSNIVATKIFDAMIKNGKGKDAPKIEGNGEPVIAGSVTSVSGSTLTITNNGSTTYTVDASTAKIMVKGSASSTVSNIVVGDRVLVQGSINGSVVKASSVIDRGVKDANDGEDNKPKPGGFFRGVGNFFKHLFGF